MVIRNQLELKAWQAESLIHWARNETNNWTTAIYYYIPVDGIRYVGGTSDNDILDWRQFHGGHELMLGGNGNDKLYGGKGNDTLFGEEGNDSLWGDSELVDDIAFDFFKRGIALYKLSRYDEAIASYDKAIEIKPDYHYAWCNRGIALYKLSRYDEAIASYDKAIEIKPNFYEAKCNRGKALSDLQQVIDRE